MQDRLRPAPDQPDTGAEPDRVVHFVCAGQDLDRPSAKSRDGIDGSLDGLIGFADEVALLLADRQREPLVPFRLRLPVARRRSRSADRRTGFGQEATAQAHDSDCSSDGAQKRTPTEMRKSHGPLQSNGRADNSNSRLGLGAVYGDRFTRGKAGRPLRTRSVGPFNLHTRIVEAGAHRPRTVYRERGHSWSGRCACVVPTSLWA